MSEVEDVEAQPNLAPASAQVSEKPPHNPATNPVDWVRANLFSNVQNSVLTVLMGALIVKVLQVLMNFSFSEERTWAAVWTNIRFLFTQAYPSDQYIRMWVSVGIVFVLVGLSLAVWRAGEPVLRRDIARTVMGAAAFLALAVLVGPFAMSTRISWWVGLAVLAGLGYALWRTSGSLSTMPSTTIWATVIVLIIALLWLYPFGHYSFVDGAVVEPQSGTVARSTQLPWTVMLMLGVGSYWLGVLLRDRLPMGFQKPALVLLWLNTLPFTFLVILRDPTFDFGYVIRVDIPMFLLFAAGGGAAIWFISKPGRSAIGRAAAALLLVVAASSWMVSLFFSVSMLQKFRLSLLLLALFAIAAPTFAGDKSSRRTYLFAWIGAIALLQYYVTVTNTPSTLASVQTAFFTGGFAITVLMSIGSLLLSFPIGVTMALARTSKMPIFRVLATGYIELIRGVPLITVLFFFDSMMPLFLPVNMRPAPTMVALLAFSLFGGAYMAENIRGGLQSVRKGQYEAAEALGMTTAQTTAFIVLPQALRNVIPPLVGQAIATFKETSLLIFIGISDFLLIARTAIPNQTAFLGVREEGLLFVCAVYWVFTYSMSRSSRRLERKLGVGDR
ncbi:MAG: amino acid ABC transporter permease [Sulfitobacter sp.]|nr:amino acid ABC transporter permease [Sulfitobacter sp.]